MKIMNKLFKVLWIFMNLYLKTLRKALILVPLSQDALSDLPVMISWTSEFIQMEPQLEARMLASTSKIPTTRDWLNASLNLDWSQHINKAAPKSRWPISSSLLEKPLWVELPPLMMLKTTMLMTLWQSSFVKVSRLEESQTKTVMSQLD